MPPGRIVARCAAIGAIAGSAIGSVAGLVIGLIAYPPTAFFAIFEAGIPATIVGTALGLIVGAVAVLVRRIRRGPAASQARVGTQQS